MAAAGAARGAVMAAAAARRGWWRRGLWTSRRALAALALLGGGTAWYRGRAPPRRELRGPAAFLTVLAQKDAPKEELSDKVSIRKQRFLQFSSQEYEGEYYMTPRDFLFSVMFDQIDRKALVRRLSQKEVEDALAFAKRARRGSSFFRDLGDKGLISYTEYLFLLTILTKPQTGFHMAFKMLDSDGDECVDKREFFKLQKIIRRQEDLKAAARDETMLTESKVEDSKVNTTLQIHFFGAKGKDKLHYKEFRRFMENLQTEVQEMEFIQFSKGLSFMRKEDFAEWLLFFTTGNKDIYWQNVKERMPAGESISLHEFKTFCQFTTHLEDFSITMQMFSVANRPVKLAEFKRAVKVATGHELSDNVLDTVFKIFDLDGDDCLSHGEFLGVLKNRMHRGLWVPQQPGLQEYWKCVKRESIKGVKEVWKQAGKPLL
ncbi:calcium uptake protein 2, mitochondrial [Ornithorhynchus anatinus]|uniref:Mitochondrial calcium uptake 2 n=1 Tax=Ornithorhynchus anatinus TaxID=9258 RepID=F7EKE7_ORNAN|nr:calcium uptake protein 2, mitochondrial [Ornithorhynchus anatinus]